MIGHRSAPDWARIAAARQAGRPDGPEIGDENFTIHSSPWFEFCPISDLVIRPSVPIGNDEPPNSGTTHYSRRITHQIGGIVHRCRNAYAFRSFRPRRRCRRGSARNRIGRPFRLPDIGVSSATEFRSSTHRRGPRRLGTERVRDPGVRAAAVGRRSGRCCPVRHHPRGRHRCGGLGATVRRPTELHPRPAAEPPVLIPEPTAATLRLAAIRRGCPDTPGNRDGFVMWARIPAPRTGQRARFAAALTCYAIVV